eukprot:CAMPEP_0184391484 /NCGR_PEP_ID=MMETSP0007-20130409/14136_1 /TAXON_ID=97485 /ORGANISM="Prymnesium parvum, Strain Texoma1" /LENGTH=183 /DNA_ID=CAMNT_0026741611 /DNA_START=76 /DNA_END=628 /DNA_ORIENTATION=+
MAPPAFFTADPTGRGPEPPGPDGVTPAWLASVFEKALFVTQGVPYASSPGAARPGASGAGEYDALVPPVATEYGGGAQGKPPRHISAVCMLRTLVRRRMRALGERNLDEWGAHSCRIGGATDLGSSKGASPLLLQARGRWASDIGKIYNRMTRQALLAASKMMYGAPKGRDLEEIFPDFAQPA